MAPDLPVYQLLGAAIDWLCPTWYLKQWWNMDMVCDSSCHSLGAWDGFYFWDIYVRYSFYALLPSCPPWAPYPFALDILIMVSVMLWICL